MNFLAHNTNIRTQRTHFYSKLFFLFIILVMSIQSSVALELGDLFGKSQRPVPANILQVQDIAADPQGYTGIITVRGVLAGFSSQESDMVAIVDTREAKACKSTGCAKFYLPVRLMTKGLNKWDELNVRGELKSSDKKIFLDAESVQNLGSIK